MPDAIWAGRLISAKDEADLKRQRANGSAAKQGYFTISPCNPNAKAGAPAIDHVSSWCHLDSGYISVSLCLSWLLWESQRRLVEPQMGRRYLLLFKLTRDILSRTTPWTNVLDGVTMSRDAKFAYDCAKVSSEILIWGDIELPISGDDPASWRIIDLDMCQPALGQQITESAIHLKSKNSLERRARHFLAQICQDAVCQHEQCYRIVCELMGTKMATAGSQFSRPVPIEHEASIMASLHCGAGTSIQSLRNAISLRKVSSVEDPEDLLDALRRLAVA